MIFIKNYFFKTPFVIDGNQIYLVIKYFDGKTNSMKFKNRFNKKWILLEKSCPEGLKLIRSFIITYFNNKEILLTKGDIKNLLISSGFILSDFSKSVLEYISKIPFGRIKTYSDIAKSLNNRAYQAIGTAVSKNPLVLLIPCHRVVSKNGIGGFMGTKDPNRWEIVLKRNLLEFEKIR